MISSKTKLILPAICGGVFIVLTSLIPLLGNLCFLWIPLGGAAGAWIMQKSNPGEKLETSDGALVGALTGFAGSLVVIVVALLLAFVLGGAYLGLGVLFASAAKNFLPAALFGGMGIGIFVLTLVIGAAYALGASILGAFGGLLYGTMRFKKK